MNGWREFVLQEVASGTPLVVQSDGTVLLETTGPDADEARDALVPFAELVKAPEFIHTYRITPLSLWNAASAGHALEGVQAVLARYSRFPVPAVVQHTIRTQMGRYGRLRLVRADGDPDGSHLLLVADDPCDLEEALADQTVRGFVLPPTFDGRRRVEVAPGCRGRLKQALTAIGWPARDLVGFRAGEPVDVVLRSRTPGGERFALRHYQRNAVAAFLGLDGEEGGAGVVVLPCGAGKTMVGLGVLAELAQHTLIVATGDISVRQWRAELLDKTTLRDEEIAEFSGRSKALGPVTLTTYQLLTHRRRGSDDYPHLETVRKRPWGLVIYDEVHLLPAPVFRLTCEIQAIRRLGLTATLVREDGRAHDVFSLVGPKRFDLPWRLLEGKGWLAQALCTEVRVTQGPGSRRVYACAPRRQKPRLAAEEPAKLEVLQALLARHEGEPTLIIGRYLDQLASIARLTCAACITGKTPALERKRLCAAFRQGDLRLLLLSSVGNYSLDLPEASVLLQVSGQFGSRQEEAQRLGRILRPKADGREAHFYTLVTDDTVETEYALRRQRFLTEQGYRYRIVDGEAVVAADARS